MTAAGGGLAWRWKAQVSRWPVRPEGPGLPHIRRFFAPLRSSFRIFLCFLGSTTTNSQRLSIYLKRQLQPSPRAKWLTKTDTKGAVLPTHLGKTRPDLLPTLGGGGGAVLWIQQREKGGGSEEMWPTGPLTHSFQVPAHSSRLWSQALPVPTRGVCTKHMILSIFAGVC